MAQDEVRKLKSGDSNWAWFVRVKTWVFFRSLHADAFGVYIRHFSLTLTLSLTDAPPFFLHPSHECRCLPDVGSTACSEWLVWILLAKHFATEDNFSADAGKCCGFSSLGENRAYSCLLLPFCRKGFPRLRSVAPTYLLNTSKSWAAKASVPTTEHE